MAIIGAALTTRRIRRRKRRDYGLYEVHLTLHDQARTGDLDDMVEALANVVREFPEVRARHGQPYLAFELHYGPGKGGMEWTLAVRCEQRIARAVDGVLAGTYLDLRLGHEFGGTPTPLAATLREPGYVLRYRKARSFVYAISSDQTSDGSPLIEAIAHAQVALKRPSSVRFQLTAAPMSIERFARRRFERHENKLARSESWGLRDAGLRGTLNQQEMRAAKRTQNRAMFWLEVQVAAETREDAKRLGGVMQARRGDNHLRPRWMVVRQDGYRRRFPTAYPPLWPTLSLRSLVSSAEIGPLLELPSARMKNVPVRRGTVSRIPAPPDVHTAELACRSRRPRLRRRPCPPAAPRPPPRPSRPRTQR